MILTNSKTFHKEGGTIKLYDYDITHLWLAGLVYANIGYWVENLFRLVSKGVLDSRNQIFPFLFCYTIAMWALYLALGTPKKARWFARRMFEGDDKKAQLHSQIYSSAKSLSAHCLNAFPVSNFGITAEYRFTSRNTQAFPQRLHSQRE